MDSAVVHVVVRSAEVPTVEDSVVVPIAEVLIVEVLIVEDSVAALVAVVPSAEARTVVDLTAADTAAAVVAEWADTDKSEHQFPDFRIRHPRNLAH